MVFKQTYTSKTARNQFYQLSKCSQELWNLCVTVQVCGIAHAWTEQWFCHDTVHTSAILKIARWSIVELQTPCAGCIILGATVISWFFFPPRGKLIFLFLWRLIRNFPCKHSPQLGKVLPPSIGRMYLTIEQNFSLWSIVRGYGADRQELHSATNLYQWSGGGCGEQTMRGRQKHSLPPIVVARLKPPLQFLLHRA